MTTTKHWAEKMFVGKADLYDAPALILESGDLFGRKYTLFANPIQQNSRLRLETWVGKDKYTGEGDTIQDAFDDLLHDLTRVFGFEFWLIKKAFDLRLDDAMEKKLGIGEINDDE